MANTTYTKARQAFLGGQIDLISNDIRCILVDGADYTPNLATDEFLTAVPVIARVAVSGSMTGKSIVDGVFDANDVTYTSVTGDRSEILVLYQHTGVDATSRLIFFADRAVGDVAIDFIPNGGSMTVEWSNGADRIFRL